MPFTMGIVSKEAVPEAPTPNTFRYVVRIDIDEKTGFDIPVIRNDIETRIDNNALRDAIPDRNTRQTIMRFAHQAIDVVLEKEKAAKH